MVNTVAQCLVPRTLLSSKTIKECPSLLLATYQDITLSQARSTPCMHISRQKSSCPSVFNIPQPLRVYVHQWPLRIFLQGVQHCQNVLLFFTISPNLAFCKYHQSSYVGLSYVTQNPWITVSSIFMCGFPRKNGDFKVPQELSSKPCQQYLKSFPVQSSKIFHIFPHPP